MQRMALKTMTKINLKNYLLVIYCCFCLCNIFFSAGVTGGILLESVNYARAVSMGEAFVSISNDINAIFYNPAGLATIENKVVLFSYQKGLVDVNCGSLVYFFPIKDFKLGLNLAMLDGGIIEINYPDRSSEIRNAQQDFLLFLTCTRNFVHCKISTGITLKSFRSVLVDEAEAVAFGIDLGIQYKFDKKMK
jgi:hypothetical protein